MSTTHFHLRWRNAPDRCFKVKFFPLRLPKFAWPHEDVRGKAESQPSHRLPIETFDSAKQRAYLCWINNCGAMDDLMGRKRPAEVS
jgi:hypothetical protein